jgi:(p)ppGpp synthase/HD superfamily hydrolase
MTAREPCPWTSPLERALRWAAANHVGQVRKGSPTPYITHPMAVAMILDREGFDETVVIAGMLHDLVEDTDATIAEVRHRFGDEVAAIVEACSEIKTDTQGAKRPWADRKRDHLAALKHAGVSTRAVILADKLHNLLCIELDLRDGRPVWPTFSAGRSDVLAYYRASLAACGSGDSRLNGLVAAVTAVLDRVEALEKK